MATADLFQQRKVIQMLKENEGRGGVHVSFEFFPPKTQKGEENLMEVLAAFHKQQPVFIDFTWGAGGTTSQKTPELCVAAMKAGYVVNMHLTCTNMPVGKVDEALAFCRAHGIRNLVALRGDPPTGEQWTASKEGFECALDLVTYVRAHHGDYFCIAVAGYPEGHPSKIDDATGRCSEESLTAEYAYLKRKVDAGADLIITQLFYDVDLFLAFVKRCRTEGISVPILPGMLPMVSYSGLMRMVQLCKTYLPPAVAERVEALKDDAEEFKSYGVALCSEMCAKILAAGLKHLHFYTLNLEASTLKVLQALSIAKE